MFQLLWSPLKGDSHFTTGLGPSWCRNICSKHSVPYLRASVYKQIKVSRFWRRSWSGAARWFRRTGGTRRRVRRSRRSFYFRNWQRRGALWKKNQWSAVTHPTSSRSKLLIQQFRPKQTKEDILMPSIECPSITNHHTIFYVPLEGKSGKFVLMQRKANWKLCTTWG